MTSHDPLHVGSVYPSFYYEDANAALEWLARAFGFRRRLVVSGDHGDVVHAEMSLGGAVVMVGSVRHERGGAGQRRLGGVSTGVCVHVDDPDAHFARAKSAGAKILQELRDEPYGSRGYSVEDLEGHHWYFGTYVPGAHWTE